MTIHDYLIGQNKYHMTISGNHYGSTDGLFRGSTAPFVKHTRNKKHLFWKRKSEGLGPVAAALVSYDKNLAIG